MNSVSEAIATLREELATAPASANAGNARNRLGMALAARGHYRWAQSCYERAEIELTKAGDLEGAALARNNRGTVLFELGHYPRALELQNEAIDALRKAGAPPLRIATALRNIGAALHKLGRFKEALERYDRALPLLDYGNPEHKPGIVALLHNRGAAKERLEDPVGAATDYEAAMIGARGLVPSHGPGRLADAAYHLAVILANAGEMSRARVLARDAVVDAMRARRPDLIWRCLSTHARIGLSGTARIAFGKIAATLLWGEARRAAGGATALRARYMGARVTGLSDLTGALIEEGRLAEALAIGTAIDRLGVADFLPQRWLKPEAVALTAAEDEVYVEWLAWSRAFRELDETPEAIAAFTRWLDAPLPVHDDKRRSKPRVLAPLANRRARVQFVVSGGRIRRLTMRSGDTGISAAMGPRAADLYRHVFRFSTACRHSFDIDEVHRQGAELFDMLLGDLGAARPGPDDVLEIVADGALRALPWAALRDGNSYLVERCAIEILCGAPHAPVRRPPHWALFGASDSAGQGGAAIPATAREVKTIAALGYALAVPPAIDDAYTCAALRKALEAGATALHIAGHFELDPADFGRSTLLLGDGTTLDARSLAAFDLSRVGEIVLSSCEAGLGDRADGAADAKSLPDLLAAVGVGHVVAALWPVADAPTADLMIDYHRARKAGLDPARALAKAQRAAIGRAVGGAGGDRGLGDPVPGEVSEGPCAWAGFGAFAAIAEVPSRGE